MLSPAAAPRPRLPGIPLAVATCCYTPAASLTCVCDIRVPAPSKPGIQTHPAIVESGWGMRVPEGQNRKDTSSPSTAVFTVFSLPRVLDCRSRLGTAPGSISCWVHPLAGGMLGAQRCRAAHPVDGEVRGHICRPSCRPTVEMNKAFLCLGP